jgi:Calcineurin-like phosphoesterase
VTTLSAVLKSALLVATLAASASLALAGLQSRAEPASVPGCARLYRQNVRTLDDPAARKIARRPTPSRISQLAALRRPRGVVSATRRLRGPERRTYRVRASLVAIRLGSGRAATGEIELVVADRRTGQRLVVGFADPACPGGSNRQAEANGARASLLAACGAPPDTHYAVLRGTAELVGVGFFGPPSGPFATRNGFQLRPAIGFRTAACSPLPERPAVVAAAGDIACDPQNPAFNGGQGMSRSCRMLATSELLVSGGFDAVFPLGDTQYDFGSYPAFVASYDPTWGRVKAITRAVIGNHEYGTPRAKGYFRYFGRAAGPPGRGYYSFNLAAWHVVVLNGNCSLAPCRAESRQERWLRADLLAHTNRCTLALWHQPLFSSGLSGGSRPVRPFWDALYEAGADLVLNGHDHDYERFAPQRPSGLADGARGIREFVVGTGGASFGPWAAIRPNSEFRDNRTFGVLKLTLFPSSYEWQFVPVAGSTFTDAGSGSCH